MEKVNLAQVGAFISTASQSEMKEMYSALKWRRGQLDQEQTQGFYIGQKVMVNGGKTHGKEFVIVKINSKTVICKMVETGQKWKVSPSFITPYDETLTPA